MKVTLLTAVMVVLAAPLTHAGQPPEKAICRACEVRGADHGAENVVASRTYEGKDYHFCSQQCAEAFDGFPAGYAVRAVPRPAPQFVIITRNHDEVVLGKPGAVTLVDFWATWCAPCVQAMPELEALQQEFGDKGLTVLGLSIDEKPEQVEKFLKKKPFTYPMAIDSGDEPAWYAYGVAAIPAMYLIDQKGEIVGEWRGKIEINHVREKIEGLLAVKQ